MNNKKDYDLIAFDILQYVGGKSNVLDVTNCITRLRLTIKDIKKVNIEKLKTINKVNGVINKETLHIVFSLGIVNYVRKSFDEVLSDEGFTKELIKSKISIKDIKLENIKDLKLFKRFIGTIQGTFAPLLPLLVGLGIIMALGSIFSANGINEIPPGANPNDHIDFLPLYMITQFATIVFNNFGILVGYTAAKHFKGNPVYGIGFGVFVYFGLPASGIQIGAISLIPGIGGVLGIIMGTYIFCKIELFLKQRLNPLLHMILVPLITLILGTLIVVFTILPLFGIIMNALTSTFEWALGDPSNNISGAIPQWIIGMVLTPIWPLLVIMGLHWAIIAVLLPILIETGQMFITPMMMMADAAMLGMAIGLMLSTKNKSQRSKTASFVASGVAGVTEPIVYGVALPNPKLYIPVLINASIFGAILGIFEPYANASALGIWAFLAMPDTTLMGIFVGCFMFSAISSTIMTLVLLSLINTKNIFEKEDTVSLLQKIIVPFGLKKQTSANTKLKLENEKWKTK